MKTNETLRKGRASYLLAAIVALAFAMCLAVPAAFAAEGKVTINAIEGQANGVTYDGFQIFNATVDNDGKVSGITWADGVQTAVENAIKAQDSSYSGTTAQDAADFIAANITGTNSTTSVEANSFAMKLAKAVVASGATSKSLTAGQAQTFEEGYVLVVTNSASLKEGADPKQDSAGTAPIFVLVNDTPADGVTITEKAKIPTVDKNVKEDRSSDNTFKYSADANVGQEIEYILTGTLPDNLTSYDTYLYRFNDQFCDALDLVIPEGEGKTAADAVTIKIDNNVVASGATVTYENHKLTVYFPDLFKTQVAGADEGAYINVTADSKVTVEYKAKLNNTAKMGSEGNNNTVYLDYSNDPTKGGEGKTETIENKVFTYQIEVVKVDRDNENTKLAGAVFTLKDANGNYIDHDGIAGGTSYADADKAKYEFTTDASGKINFKGLDEGEYTLTEIKAPDNYSEQTNPIIITITSELDRDKTNPSLTKLGASWTGGPDDGIDHEDADGKKAGDEGFVSTDGMVETGSGLKSIETNAGKINALVTNVKEITMPLTGLDGITVTYVVGGIILALSVFALLRRRMSNRTQEDVA